MAREFNGSTMYGESGSTPVTAAPITMAAWYYNDTLTDTDEILWVGDNGANDQGFSLQVGSGGVFATTQAGSGSFATSAATPSTGQWQHACAVFASATDRRVFLNGANKGTNSTSRTPTGVDTISVGRRSRSSADNYFDGRIAEAAIWNAALSDEEVAALGNGYCPLLIKPASLVAYWPLFGHQSPEPDRWRGTYPLTLTNTPTKADHPGRIYYPVSAL